MVYFLSFAHYKGCITDRMQPSLATRRLSFTSASQVRALKEPKIEPPQCVKHVVKHSAFCKKLVFTQTTNGYKSKCNYL